jgi:hypothetical protein
VSHIFDYYLSGLWFTTPAPRIAAGANSTKKGGQIDVRMGDAGVQLNRL